MFDVYSFSPPSKQNFSQGIKITATTPSSTAVRLETGSVNLEVSNNEPVIKKESSSNIESKILSKARFPLGDFFSREQAKSEGD